MPKLRVSRMLNLKQHSSLKTPRLLFSLFSLFILSTLTLSGLALFKQTNPITHALDSNLSNGITVDSTLDTGDTSIGDGSCDDGGGHCTLRAAIQEANSNPDASTILFNITGTPSFTNNSQPGYTISPTSALPNITEQLTIDGYSQPGAEPNTAPAPQPLNGTLLVEVDGSGAGGAHGIDFDPGSTNSAVRGLVIGGFANADALQVTANNIQIQGNYIGTNPTGTAANPNQLGVNALIGNPNVGEDALLGGLDPEDRNLISGNTAGSIAAAAYPGPGWVIQGNYVGVGADGLTPIEDSTVGGSGAFSIDYSDDVIVGGPQPTAINVFGSSLGHGIAPDNSDNLLIEGNYIGLGYDGTTILGSGSTGFGSGIALSSSNNVTIKNNRVAGWESGGININGGNSNVLVEGNTTRDNRRSGIALGSGSTDITVSNNTIYDNRQNGICIISASDVNIESNTVYDNELSNISVSSFSGFGGLVDNVSFTGNDVGLDSDGVASMGNSVGILIFGDPTNIIIGGSSPADANKIASNKGSGIQVQGLYVDVASVGIYPAGVSILGNSIYDTSPASNPSEGAGLGIDLMVGVDTDPSPDGQPNTFTNVGPDANDNGDSDTGPNNYINFPTLNSVTQDGTTATINFNLDASDSPTNQYRIEFFSNDTADPSGYGEGQTFLGSTTVTNGNNQLATLSLPSNLNLSSKSISATTTAIDNTTNSGFGSTSEFSPIVLASVTTPTTTSNQGSNSSSLASTGSNTKLLSLIALLLVILSITAATLNLKSNRSKSKTKP